MVLAPLIGRGIGISEELAALVERVRASVVEVRSGRGGGSGVIWAADGLIVTNHHVVSGETAEVRLADGRQLTGQVEQRDVERDLALLRVPATDLPAATIGAATDLRVGDLVIAIGNPLGLTRAVNVGMISGPTAGRHGALEWRDTLQVELQLRPGNSGGPLLDSAGRVVGINTMVIGPRTALAIPSHAVTALVTGAALL